MPAAAKRRSPLQTAYRVFDCIVRAAARQALKAAIADTTSRPSPRKVERRSSDDYPHAYRGTGRDPPNVLILFQRRLQAPGPAREVVGAAHLRCSGWPACDVRHSSLLLQNLRLPGVHVPLAAGRIA